MNVLNRYHVQRKRIQQKKDPEQVRSRIEQLLNVNAVVKISAATMYGIIQVRVDPEPHGNSTEDSFELGGPGRTGYVEVMVGFCS